MARKVYTCNGAFENSEWVKIDCVRQVVPNINYTVGKKIYSEHVK